MLWIGTSGFSYADWVGPFYPPGTRTAHMLALYARRFRTVEVNFTFYSMPGRRSIEGMASKVPAGFRFTMKLHQSMTHGQDLEGTGRFLEALAPMREAGMLACLLAQFPYSFHNEERSRTHVARIADRFAGLPVAVEFRHRSWAAEPVHAFLRGRGLATVCVDEPRLSGLMPDVAVATSPLAYVRFHGRNAAKWFEHDRPEERYDYLYDAQELEGWLDRIRRLEGETQEVYVYFNNHFGGKAPANAQMLAGMLDTREADV